MALNKPSVPYNGDTITVGNYYLIAPLNQGTAVDSVFAPAIVWASLSALKGRTVPLPGVGKTVMIPDFDISGGVLKMEIDVLENPIPVAAFVAGIAVLLGLGLIALTFWQLEKIVEASPDIIGDVGGVIIDFGFVLLLLLGVYLWWKGKFS